MHKKPLRVGFDLDGVLLYNPARIARPLIVAVKKIISPQKAHTFRLPKNRLEKFIWMLLHKSSFTTASGLAEIKTLIKEKKIEAYIISARYESLKNDFEEWIRKIDAKSYFSGIHYNNDNEQPHHFKHRMIQKLKLDVFVEDNWDIVQHLSTDHELRTMNCKILWIYNLFDRHIDYKYKYRSLKEAIFKIKSLL